MTAGRKVEEQVREALENNSEPLSDKKLKEVFEPVVKYVEERTELKVRQEIDEVRAQQKAAKQDAQLEDAKDQIRYRVSNSIIFNVNGKRCRKTNEANAKRVKREINDAIAVLEPTIQLSIEERPPQTDLDELERDDEILRHDSFSVHWEKYVPSYDIKAPEGFDKLLFRGIEGLTDYIRTTQTPPSMDQISQILKNGYTILGESNYSLPEHFEKINTAMSKSTFDRSEVIGLFSMLSDFEWRNSHKLLDIYKALNEQSSLAQGCANPDCGKSVVQKDKKCAAPLCRLRICDTCVKQEGVLHCEKHQPPTPVESEAEEDE